MLLIAVPLAVVAALTSSEDAVPDVGLAAPVVSAELICELETLPAPIVGFG